MTEAVIGILFAAGGVGIYLILKDAFSRDESGRYKLTKGFYRKLLSLEGHGSLLTFSAFSRSNKVQGVRGLPAGEEIRQSTGAVDVTGAINETKM